MDKDLTWAFIAIIAGFLALVFFTGCDKIVVVLPPDAAVVVNDDLGTEETPQDSPEHPSGRLPLGYYQLGCAWDAPCDESSAPPVDNWTPGKTP